MPPCMIARNKRHLVHTASLPPHLRLCLPASVKSLFTTRSLLRCTAPVRTDEFSFFQGSVCSAPPSQFWGLPKWTGTGCSVVHQRLTLNLLASSLRRSLRTFHMKTHSSSWCPCTWHHFLHTHPFQFGNNY